MQQHLWHWSACALLCCNAMLCHLVLMSTYAQLFTCKVCVIVLPRRPTFKQLLPKLEWYLQLTRDFTIEQLELPLRSTAPMQ
jgi:hypothetical protein